MPLGRTSFGKPFLVDEGNVGNTNLAWLIREDLITALGASNSAQTTFVLGKRPRGIPKIVAAISSASSPICLSTNWPSTNSGMGRSVISRRVFGGIPRLGDCGHDPNLALSRGAYRFLDNTGLMRSSS